MTDGIGDSNSAAVPRLAASVILLRDTAQGPEVFVQHRVSTMDFAAGMVVFPGGRVDDADRSGRDFPAELLQRHAAAWRRSSLASVEAVSDPAVSGPAASGPGDAEQGAVSAQGWVSPEDASMLLAAALREVYEEAGIELDPASLMPWANWVTPTDQPKRFDTFFFVAPLAAGMEPRHVTTEASSSDWMLVREVLEQEAGRTLKLMPPTLFLLRELLELGGTDAVLAMERDIVPVRPPAGALREFLKGRE